MPCSTFREASRVALASFTLILCAMAAQIAIWAIWPALSINMNEWIKKGSAYAQENVFRIAVNLTGTTVTACLVGIAAAWAISKFKGETATLSNGNPWQEALRASRPRDSNAWAHVQLQDGTAFFGYVESWTLNEKPEERDILLYGTTMMRARRSDTGTVTNDECIGLKWEKVVISAFQISYIRVVYLDALGEPMHSARRTDELQALARRREEPAQENPAAAPADQGTTAR